MPTVAALRTDPMPSTIVQKITGAIIILIKRDEHRAENADALADLGGEQADRDADQHRGDHGDVEPVRAVLAARRIRRLGYRRLAVNDCHVRDYLQVDIECDVQVGSAST